MQWTWITGIIFFWIAIIWIATLVRELPGWFDNRIKRPLVDYHRWQVCDREYESVLNNVADRMTEFDVKTIDSDTYRDVRDQYLEFQIEREELVLDFLNDTDVRAESQIKSWQNEREELLKTSERDVSTA